MCTRTFGCCQRRKKESIGDSSYDNSNSAHFDSQANKLLLEKKTKVACRTLPEDLNDKGLARFLRAFGTVDKALTAILSYLKWRKEFGVDFITADSPEIKVEMKSGKAVLLEERDLMSRPIIMVRARMHNPKERNLQNLTRFIVYLLESASKKCNDDMCDNFCILFDMKDFSMNTMDYQFVKNLIWLLSNYYPERLGVWLIVNPPVLFTGCWIIIRGWLDETTAKKVVFVNKPEQLTEYIHPEILPTNLFH
ncbi:CRAL-TRIO domain-containing protein C589.09, mitochondrial [Callorhinchus milii]|nr:CRAL-TRIO domain-containing protein C589.09, mitochondrial [Callorhinchus milii]|eukprot:gi/632967750/ref/XP_007900153.1/ PREDICTED: CRAL-TRIO domain-containing protein C589.09, mitochondrial-like [Callorhinchus milii]